MSQIPTASGSLRVLKQLFRKDPDRFLWKVRGVIHVGANAAQERMLYADKLLQVVWIEPLADVFRLLQGNIKDLPSQIGINALVGERDGEKTTFYVSPGTRAASSIFPLKEVTEIWPDVTFESERVMITKTLPTLLAENNINLSDFQCLILDTQGSELMILRGAESILHVFDYIKLEVANFEAYSGCATLPQVTDYLLSLGFEEFSRRCFASSGERKYYDIVYRRHGAHTGSPIRIPLRRPKALRHDNPTSS